MCTVYYFLNGFSEEQLVARIILQTEVNTILSTY